MTPPQKTTIELQFEDSAILPELYGQLNKNLTIIAESTNVTLNARSNKLSVKGFSHETKLAATLLEQLYAIIKAGYPVYPADIAYALRVLQKDHLS